MNMDFFVVCYFTCKVIIYDSKPQTISKFKFASLRCFYYLFVLCVFSCFFFFFSNMCNVSGNENL